MRAKRLLLSLPILIGIVLYMSWSELVWFATQLSDTPEAYASYAEQHPNGPHTEMALACLDELEWRLTKSYDGILGYQYYLDRLPNGPHAEQARKELREARLEEALGKGTRAAIEAHGDIYPEDMQDERVLSRLESLEWRKVVAGDSRLLYIDFLERFQHGEHVQEATQKLSSLNFRLVTLKNDKRELEDYLASGPPEEYLKDAEAQLDELIWGEIAESPSIESVRGYLEQTRQDRHLEDAKELLEELVWEAAETLQSRQSIESYLQEFPAGIYVPLARGALEHIAWSEALESRSLEGLQAYMQEYPEGVHLAEIPSAQEQMLWDLAEERGDLKHYEEYLKRFPDGPHSLAAENALQGRSVVQLQALDLVDLKLTKVKSAFVELELTLVRDPSSVLGSQATTIEFPVGLVFESEDQTLADLVVVRAGRLRVEPDARQAMRLNVALFQGRRVGPPASYALPARVDPIMEVMLGKMAQLGLSIKAIQLVLFIAVDDLGLEALSAVHGPSEGQSSSALIVEAMQACQTLGLDVSRQKIWKERAVLRADLPAGDARQWLSQPDTLGDAVRFGSIDQMRELLDAGADPNLSGTPGDDALSPLALALQGDRLDLAKLLVAGGADPYRKQAGDSLLAQAVLQGRADWVRLLLSAGDTPRFQPERQNELCLAASLDNTQITKLLLEAGAPLNGPSELAIPLNLAAGAGHLQNVKLLVASQATLDLGTDSALILAAAGGHLDVLGFLIQAGAKIDRPGKWGYTALHKSIEHGQLACAKALLQAGSDVNRDAGGFRPIDLAALHAPALLKFLAANGAEETIFASVALGDLDGIERCLARGESLERWGTDAHRPLHVAARAGQGEALLRLLGHGADPKARTTDGFQPLHLAVKEGWAAGIRALVEHGADLNDLSQSGTPLQLAVRAGDLETSELLLGLGADPARKRAQDKSALDLARAGAAKDPDTFGALVELLAQASRE